jgi:hypothetical protein
MDNDIHGEANETGSNREPAKAEGEEIGAFDLDPSTSAEFDCLLRAI